MKSKTSITLSADLLESIDRLCGASQNRSAFIEAAVRAHIARLLRAERDARDRELIARRAERLNREALDVLAFQGDW